MTNPAATGFSRGTIRALLDCADPDVAPARRARLARRLRQSPATAQALERQLRARAALDAVAPPVPLTLRASIAGSRTQRHRPARRMAPRVAAVAATIAAAAAAVLFAPSGPGPSTAERVAAQARPAQPAAAPAPDRAKPAVLDVRGAGLTFPNLSRRFGLRAVASGPSTVDGRAVTSVVYAKGARTVTYSILGGRAAGPAPPGRALTRRGTRFVAFEHEGRTAITWTRRGRTCVLSGAGARAEELVRLAMWRPPPGA